MGQRMAVVSDRCAKAHRRPGGAVDCNVSAISAEMECAPPTDLDLGCSLWASVQTRAVRAEASRGAATRTHAGNKPSHRTIVL